jgi:hypothetical protein
MSEQKNNKVKETDIVEFNKLMDSLVLFAIEHKDQELLDGIQYIDRKSRDEGKTFHEKMFEVVTL